MRAKFLAAAGVAAAAGLGVWAYAEWKRKQRRELALSKLERWCAHGPSQEPIVECTVPIDHGFDGAAPEFDIVEVPVGLIFECERIRDELAQTLKVKNEAELVEVLSAAFPSQDADTEPEEELGPGQQPVSLNLPWLDLAALAQLTYWYDRRPRDAEDNEPVAPAEQPIDKDRLTEAKYGRWTKKISTEKVIYGTVALRYRTRGHLGQQVFRRPAGVDVTRLTTLRRAAAIAGHGALLSLVEETMEKLQPRNVAKIPWAEVKRHVTKDDLWLLIDGKVYDVTPFLNLHPGGGHLVLEAAGKDSTSLFERTHGEGLRYSLRLLNQFFIGVCPDGNEAEAASKALPTQEFLTTLRSITGALHTFDEAKATGEAQGMLR